MSNEIDWPHELHMLRYFWEDKGDLERYCDWEQLVPKLREKYPEILVAWEHYKVSRRSLTAVLRGLEAYA